MAPHDYLVQYEYITTLTKLYSMDASQLANHLDEMIELLNEFPKPNGALSINSDISIKGIIHCGLHTYFQRKLQEANLEKVSMTKAELVSCFYGLKSIQSQSDSKQQGNDNNFGTSGNKRFGKPRQGNNNSNSKSSNKCGNGNSSVYDNSNNKKPCTDNCHFHPNCTHDWVNCFTNKNGPNYCPDILPKPQQSNHCSNESHMQSTIPTQSTTSNASSSYYCNNNNHNKIHNCDDQQSVREPFL
jgi:hypothetical protein